MKKLKGLLVVLFLTGITYAQTDVAQPIRLHPQNPHYFLYRGKTVALVTSAAHYGAVFNADFDYHKYLDTMQSEGMNYTRIFGGSYVEVPGKSFGILRNTLAPAPGRFIPPWPRSEVAGYAGGGNKFDLSKWDPAYFSRLRDFLAEANRHGIIVELTLFSSQYGDLQWNVSPFKRENNVNATDAIDWKTLNTLDNGTILPHQERYVRKLVREANPFPNVIFELANEPWSDRTKLADVVNPYLFTGRDQYPNSVDLPDDATMAWQERVAGWVTSEESSLPNKHLIAQNCCNFRYAVHDLLPGVSIVNFHYAYPEAATLNYGLGKALSYDETGFLGQSDDAYTRQAWNFMLSGGGVFDGLDYSFTVGHEDGTDTEPNGPGGGSPGLRRRLRILSGFLNSMPLVDLAPDFTTVKHAGGVVTHTLSSTRGEYAIYLDGDGPTDLTLTLPPGDYSLYWLDVRTGATLTPTEIKNAAPLHHTGGDLVLKAPEFHNGIALRVTRQWR